MGGCRRGAPGLGSSGRSSPGSARRPPGSGRWRGCPAGGPGRSTRGRPIGTAAAFVIRFGQRRRPYLPRPPRLRSQLSPAPPVSLDEPVSLFGTPCPGRVIGELWWWLMLPAFDDAVNQGPLRLDLILAGEQLGLAHHAVEDEPLVGVGHGN